MTELRVSVATWDHTMLLATRHKQTHSALTHPKLACSLQT